MLEIKAVVKLLDILKNTMMACTWQKENKDLDPSYLHNNNRLMEFYSQL